MITGASDDDPSGIGTYAQTGAQFGYGQLWTMLYALPLMIVVQEICGRIALQTGGGLTYVLRRYFPRPVLYFCVLLLLVANTINIGADLGAMAAAGQMLVGIPFLAWLLVITLLSAALQIFADYQAVARVLRLLTLALFVYVLVVFFVRQDWPAALRSTLVPTISTDKDFVLNVVAVLGTTISPYLFFWQAEQEVEEEKAEGKRTRKQREGVTRVELKWMRTDIATGMLLSNVVAWFIILTTAATLARAGQTDIDSAAKAAEALKPVAGDLAGLVFALGIIGTGMLAVPVLAGSAAYAVATSLAMPCGLSLSVRQAPGFYIVIALATLAGSAINLLGINPIQALYYTAVLNGIIAPPLLTVIMLVGNSRVIMKDKTNSAAANVLGWLTVLLMSLAALAVVFNLVMGGQ